MRSHILEVCLRSNAILIYDLPQLFLMIILKSVSLGHIDRQQRHGWAQVDSVKTSRKTQRESARETSTDCLEQGFPTKIGLVPRIFFCCPTKNITELRWDMNIKN